MAKHKYIESPEKLLELFKEYQQYQKDNPIYKQDFVGKDANEVQRQLERPLSWVGFESYLFNMEIIGDLGDYESNKDGRYEEYATIISRIKRFIQTDQFEGATVGIYKENIISRMLGLVDKSENKNDNNNVNSGTMELNDIQFEQLLNAAKQDTVKADSSE